MKLPWTIILGIFVLAIFGGLFSMAYGNIHDHICFAALLNGLTAPCPQANPLGFASFHSNALKKISNLILIDGINGILLYLFSAILSFGLAYSYLRKPASYPAFSGFVSKFKTENCKLEAVNLYWFALHENSPAFFRSS